MPHMSDFFRLFVVFWAGSGGNAYFYNTGSQTHDCCSLYTSKFKTRGETNCEGELIRGKLSLSNTLKQKPELQRLAKRYRKHFASVTKVGVLISLTSRKYSNPCAVIILVLEAFYNRSIIGIIERWRALIFRVAVFMPSRKHLHIDRHGPSVLQAYLCTYRYLFVLEWILICFNPQYYRGVACGQFNKALTLVTNNLGHCYCTVVQETLFSDLISIELVFFNSSLSFFLNAHVELTARI